MSEETAKATALRINTHCVSNNIQNIIITFHGGEPLLAGHKRLQKYYEVFQKEITNASVGYGMQTNAVLIDDDYIKIFKKFNATVSVSIDGPQQIHDKNRVSHSGGPSFDLVYKGLNTLVKNAPEVVSGLLAVIDVESHPSVQLNFFGSLGIPRIDFLLPLNHWDRKPARPTHDPEVYGRWLFDLFNHWNSSSHLHFLRIRILEHLISRLVGGISLYEVGTMDPVRLLVISSSGNYECVDSIKSTGSGLQKTGFSVFESEIDVALESPLITKRFSAEKQLCAECLQCSDMSVCGGGYFPHRFKASATPNEFDNPSVYCSDLKWLYNALRNKISEQTLHK